MPFQLGLFHSIQRISAFDIKIRNNCRNNSDTRIPPGNNKSILTVSSTAFVVMIHLKCDVNQPSHSWCLHLHINLNRSSNRCGINRSSRRLISLSVPGVRTTPARVPRFNKKSFFCSSFFSFCDWQQKSESGISQEAPVQAAKTGPPWGGKTRFFYDYKFMF